MVRRDGSPPAHHVFRDLPSLLNPGDLLVLNDTRVLPARLIGRRARSGGKWEGLFLREQAGAWELLTQTRGRLIVGETLLVDGPERRGRSSAAAVVSGGQDAVAAAGWPDRARRDRPSTLLARYGRMPLPPYIRKGRAATSGSRTLPDRLRRAPGAVAAPTAGLHFTPRRLRALRQRGIERTFVTLHVGPGTFQPVSVEDVDAASGSAGVGRTTGRDGEAVVECKRRGGRVVAVGTTSVRIAGDGGAGAVVRLDGLDHPAAV